MTNIATNQQVSPPRPADADQVDWVARARALAPLITQRADEIEATKEVTADVWEAIVESGLLWMLVPAQYGGGEVGSIELIKVLEELGRADGSTSWTVMANSAAAGAASAFLVDEGMSTVFDPDAMGVLAGQLAPMGTGVEVEGGYRFTGDYRFASGSAYANWIGAGFHIMDNGTPRLLPNGLPQQVVAFVPKSAAEFRGGWDVTGMVGTASYDYHVEDAFVPYELTFERASLTPVRPQPAYALGLAGLAVGGHAGVVLGLTRRALEEVATLTDGKKRVGYSVPIDEHPVFLYEFAKHEALFQSARSYLFEVYRDAEASVARGEAVSAVQRARLRQAATWVHNVSSDVVDFCRLWAGSPSFRNPSVLGRVIRDIGVASQHALLDQVTLIDAARELVRDWRQDH